MFHHILDQAFAVDALSYQESLEKEIGTIVADAAYQTPAIAKKLIDDG